ncbi:MAG: choice-of-anchor tandem repeat GloVer-containing protein, partial [Bacteroidia bacterium]
KLKDFDYVNGGNPYGSLVQAADGKLYGVTSAGGKGYIIREDTTGAGVIFSIDPSKFIYKKLREFDYYNDGGYAYGSLIKATDGKLYGMTNSGGMNNAGVIFSFDPTQSTFNKLNDFDGINGASPYGNLMQAGDGKLYGMTFEGGINNFGVIFSFDPTSSFFNKLIDFDAANGANPYLGSAFIEVPESGPLPVTLLSFTGKNNGNTNQLTWKVINEQGLDYYELQRSSDGQTFTERFETKAFGQSSYSYNDNISDGASPVYYYRLKSVDIDGNFKYSGIVQLRNDYNKNFVIVNPNPFKDRLLVTIASPVEDKVTFLLTDISGKQLLKETRHLFTGTNVVVIDETNNLAKGTYMLTITRPNQSQTIKVIKAN